ncbi:MAG: putative 2-dehydropantoate 2-reductase [Cyanobacteria bacterium P01_D01_bin.105]
MTLSYAVLGTGAIGGYYGGRLSKSGCDVHFLLRSDYAHVNANGIVVESVDGDFSLPDAKAYSDPVDMPPVDVVLVCLKTTHNQYLYDLLPPLKSDAVILTLQNGLAVESSIEERLKARMASVPTIFGGLCFICANKVGPGHIRHIDYGRLMLGEHVPAVSSQFAPVERLKAIATDFNRANVATDITHDLPMARWLKLVWNIPYNGLSVVLNATTEEMMADSEVRALIVTLMREVVVIANAWGQANAKVSIQAEAEDRALSEDVIEQMIEHTETMPAYLTSMKLDFDQKRPLELESILGAPLQIAKSLGVSAPTITMLQQQLTFLNARNIQ